MKTRLLTLAMLLCTLAAKAQYVTIPDPAFALFLQQTYPNCMNGNQMDTTCNDIVSETYVICSHAGIVDLNGIQYFDSLIILNCSYNDITVLPKLPYYLAELHCYSNNLNAWPEVLPNSLVKFYCQKNNLDSLPILPLTLENLICDENQLHSLPVLPSLLLSLSCSYNPITALPQLPPSLQILNCNQASLTSLSPLPSTLVSLYVGYNQLSAIPILPANLQHLHCDSNHLQSLPTLPTSLKDLSFARNSISIYPTLPASLLELNCSGNPITSLPGLPSGLHALFCNSIQVSALPTLPPSLWLLECSDNILHSLPAIPSVTNLNCSNNPLATLPILSPSLQHLKCSFTNVSSIPDLHSIKELWATDCPNLNQINLLPDTLDYLFIYNNPNLYCVPPFKHVNQQFQFFNTNISCLPISLTAENSFPSIDTLPICNQFNNPNACTIYANISGRTYTDRNINCSFDSTDIGQFGLKHNLYGNGVLVEQTYSNNIGNYSFDQTGFGNFETRLDTLGLPFTIGCPVGGVYYDTLTANDSIHFNRDFALQCETGFDLAARSIASNMVFRPANNTVVDIHAGDLANFYQASCAQGVSGTVTVTLHGPISYISPANGATTPNNVSNNVLTWNVVDFGAADALNNFNIIVQTDTFAQSGQQACFEVNITPLTGDNDTSNNHLYYCFDIVNSYDPNDKTAYPSGNIDTTQEWLTYTVRFQNTGNAEAQHIYIMDTLDANVKEETFQLLSYSHQPNVQIKENIVRFNFPFINLPDSTTDEPGSHGYVQYKVKLKEDLAIGTAINNTAYIYFDFNPPVVTNTATNTIAVEEDTVEVGIRSISKSFDLLVYPNPANQQVTVTTNTLTRTVTIFDMTGRIRIIQNMNGTSATIDISNLPGGIYFVGTSTSNVCKRLVKL